MVYNKFEFIISGGMAVPSLSLSFGSVIYLIYLPPFLRFIIVQLVYLHRLYIGIL
ncbi:hypothetical protein SAMN05660841_01793 [Sphingobacterium nematocida]|uniref:Uncharacterized protein n=1 Tax=Sphingobacterium nematocida TaxID=1513896 RepID=A0A1T5D7A2_9SPHI|nr:hypothetical protein SAMN05660841_01793 [Sphingobacterium nematocida]